MADRNPVMKLLFEAEDRASDKTSRFLQNMARETESFQRQAFNASHTARDRELRDQENYFAQEQAQYAKRGAAIARAEELARGQLQGVLAGRAVGRGGEEGFTKADLERERATMATVQAVRQQFDKSNAALEEAAAAKRAESVAKDAQEQAAIELSVKAKRQADLAKLDDQVFNSTHSARDRELRDVHRHAEELRAQYTGDAEMHARIADAEGRQVAEVDERYQQQRLKKLFSPRSLRTLLGGYALTVGAQEAFNVAAAMAESSKASGIAANPNAKLADVASSRLAATQAISSIFSAIPIFGAPIKSIYEGATNRPGLEELQRSAAAAAQSMGALSQAVGQAAAKLTSMEATLRGHTGEETALRKPEQAALERSAQLYAAKQAVDAANLAYGQAFTTGVGVPQARRMQDEANERYVALAELQRQQEGMEKESAGQVALQSQVNFLRQTQERQAHATYQRLPQTLQSRQGLETADMGRRQDVEMDQFAGLEGRQQALEDYGKWMQDWTERTVAERMAANPSQNEAELRTKVEGESGAAYNTEVDFAQRQQQRRDEIVKTQQQERDGLTVTHVKERAEILRDFDVRSQMADVSGPSRADAEKRGRLQLQKKQQDELKQFAEGSPEYKKARETQEKERISLENQFSRDRTDSSRQWAGERAAAMAAGDMTIAGSRKRDLDDLQRWLDKEKEIYGADAELLALNKSKKDAINEKYSRLQRSSEAEFTVNALRAAVKNIEAEQVGIHEKYAQEREKFKDDPNKLKMLGVMESRDIEVASMRSQPGRETQSIEQRFATRVGGFEETPESKQLTALNAQMAQLIEQTLIIAGKDPIKITSVRK